MSKVLAVFGATGQQGKSVIDFVLDDPQLLGAYKLRAITRDVASVKAQKLKEKIEVVAGDVSDRNSLEAALTGVHTVFAMTTPSFTSDGYDVEFNNAKFIADVAVAKGASYIIFSTLPEVRSISGGRYTKVVHFDAKARAERYIRGLAIKSAFFSPGVFMENFRSIPAYTPQRAADGTWVIAQSSTPEARLPLINTVEDCGKFIGAMLATPEAYVGKTFCAATALYSMKEIAAIMSKSASKEIVYRQVPRQDFAKGLPPVLDEAFPDGIQFVEEFGYYGPETEELVSWAVKNARGKLNTLEEYLQAHPLQLQ